MIRLSAFFYLWPHRFIESCDWQEKESLVSWSINTYDWRQDDWNGMKDTVQRPQKTWESGAGDCDDYALVVASYLANTTDNTLHVCALYTIGSGHMVIYDETEERVYSSGVVLSQTLSEYKSKSKYGTVFTQNVQ